MQNLYQLLQTNYCQCLIIQMGFNLINIFVFSEFLSNFLFEIFNHCFDRSATEFLLKILFYAYVVLVRACIKIQRFLLQLFGETVVWSAVSESELKAYMAMGKKEIP